MFSLKGTWNILKPYLPAKALPIVIFLYRRCYMKLLCRCMGLWDQRYLRSVYLTGGQAVFAPIPPASLRYRVHGDPYIKSFLEIGKRCSQDIEAALSRIGKNLNSFQHILDFGCGCGRILFWFADRSLSTHFYGTDVDREAIAWCHHNLHFASFSLNHPLPPLEYASEKFDLVYAISVFTHLNEDYQFRWLQELRRVIKFEGILLLTVHGYHFWKNLPREEVNKIEKAGFVFKTLNNWKGLFPDWYQTAYHTQKYILDQYSAYFDILDYIPGGLNDHQDIVLLQKR